MFISIQQRVRRYPLQSEKFLTAVISRHHMTDQFDTRLALTILVLAMFAMIIMSAALDRHQIVVFRCWFIITGALIGISVLFQIGGIDALEMFCIINTTAFQTHP
jgi:pheromone shutdown protein TraB